MHTRLIRVLSVTAVILVIIGATLGEVGSGDPARISALAACTALILWVDRKSRTRIASPDIATDTAPTSTQS